MPAMDSESSDIFAQEVIVRAVARAEDIVAMAERDVQAVSSKGWLDSAETLGMFYAGPWRTAEFRGAGEVRARALRLGYRFMEVAKGTRGFWMPPLVDAVLSELSRAEQGIGDGQSPPSERHPDAGDVMEFEDAVLGRLDTVGYALEALRAMGIELPHELEHRLRSYERRNRPILARLENQYRRELGSGFQVEGDRSDYPPTFWWRHKLIGERER